MLKRYVTLTGVILLSACTTLPEQSPASGEHPLSVRSYSGQTGSWQSRELDDQHLLLSHHWQHAPKNQSSDQMTEHQQGTRTEHTEDLSQSLLNLVDDSGLNQFIQTALEHNQDLRSAAIRLYQSQLQSGITQAGQLPEVSLGFNSQREKQSVLSTSHNLSLNLSWELDIWGRLADASSAAELEHQASAQDFAAAQHSLVGRIIQRWLDISVRSEIISVEKQRIDSLQNTLEVITDRYRDGLGSLADLEAARATMAQTMASVSAREQEQAEAIQQLNLLAGRSATEPLQLPEKVPEIKAPPARLPAHLVSARPDLIAAWQRIQAADKQQAVAEKSLLPGFNLTATTGKSNSDLGDLLSASTGWSLLGNLTAPLFNAGRLRAEAEIQSMATELAYLNYQKTLLTALQETEAALGQESALTEQQHYLNQALRHSEASLNYYRSRYRDGLTSILDLLSTEQTAYEARIQLLTVKQARLTNRITLGLALGMGV